MTLTNPAGLALLGLVVPILLLHVLRPRREERAVSSTFLWTKMDRPVTARAPWQRLTPSWLLLLQLLAVVGLALLVANPSRVSPAPLASHTVFLIDASGSMQAVDGTPDRLASAVDRALELRDELPDGGTASVIQVGPTPRVLLATDSDPQAFADAVQRVQPSEGAADFARAFALAAGLETSDTPIGFVLISDGGLTDEELAVVPSGLTYEPIGTMDTNRAITDLRVEPRGTGLYVEAVIEHTGGPTATQTVRIDVDGRTRHQEQITLSRGERATVSADVASGDRVEAYLEGEDLLAGDNRRWAVTARRSALGVAVIGDGDPFVAAVLDALDGVTVTSYPTAAQYTAAVDADPGARADVLVFDRVAVPAEPSSPFWAIAPPDGVDGVAPVGTVELPIISLVRTDDPLLRELDLSQVGIARAQQVDTTGVVTLVGAEDAPLLLRGRHGGRPFLYTTFSPTASNLPVQTAFPILVDRLLAELGGSALPPTDLIVGQPLRVVEDDTTVTDPRGRSVTARLGEPLPIADQTGFWTLQAPGRPAQVVAVNPDISESSLATASAVPSAVRTTRPGTEAPRNEESLRPWIIAATLAVLGAEWLLSRRQVGVGARQWRYSQVARAAVAVALIAALFDAGFDYTPDRVATVFVIDASDSMGPAGRADALGWTQDALRSQPDDAVAGVVLFGGDARIEALMQQELRLGQPAVQVDSSSTDLAAALRLGAAILPEDAGRRIVLLSDGRATTGDAADEAARIAADGIAIDVHVIDRQGTGDTAVAGIDAPGFIRDGEALEIRATVQAAQDGPVEVSLRRDGELVESRSVELQAGSNVLRLVDPAPPPGLHRYTVEALSSDDLVPENNRAFAPVQVGESRGVLIVEGSSGNGAALAAALEAGGTPVRVGDVGAIDGVDSLVGYDATVLVDVPISDLTAAQVEALSSSVRDLGRGLVTIGGLQSYGLGGYLGSELETVLPVVSDVLDPQRRQTVAEVLAIDTSGSMGACHCAEGFTNTSRLQGGVTKTDIARAGASRAIGVLSPSDEVGVMAFDTQARWVIDLQPVPEQDVIADGLGSLVPDGGTRLGDSLTAAAEQLRESNASLKHIIFFSDGFTDPAALAALADQAATLLEEDGITTSVIATGEGAADGLRPIAEAGGGRFYPGRDLNRIPEIIVEEALLASRDYVVEGEFLPEVVSNDDAVRSLTASPPLFGYVASTTKPPASTLLRIGPDGDPLLATWQVGLGTATSWTSDASQRWSQAWASWDGYVTFWNDVVRDTFPSPSGDVETRARVDGDLLTIEVDSADAFPDGSEALARVTTPSGESIEVALDRISENVFAAEIPADEQGIYAVGTSVGSGTDEPEGADGDDQRVSGTAMAARSYSAEYRPGAPDRELMTRVASATGGRVDAAPTTAFDLEELTPGRARFSLVPWLLLFAALLWPLAVALSRISIRRGVPFADERAGKRAADRNAALQVRRRRSEPATPEAPVAARPGDSTPPADDPGARATPSRPPQPTSTLDALLARKRKAADPDAN